MDSATIKTHPHYLRALFKLILLAFNNSSESIQIRSLEHRSKLSLLCPFIRSFIHSSILSYVVIGHWEFLLFGHSLERPRLSLHVDKSLATDRDRGCHLPACPYGPNSTHDLSLDLCRTQVRPSAAHGHIAQSVLERARGVVLIN